MSEKQIQPFDFSKPTGLALETADQMTVWLEGFSNLIKEKWAQIATTGMEIKFESDQALSFAVARSRMPKPAVAYQMPISADGFSTLLMAARQPMLEIVLTMLGESLTELPEDRSLSAVEYSLAEMFFQEIASALAESWPDQEALPCQVEGTESQPHRSRLFSPKKLVLVFLFSLELGCGPQELMWVVPQEELERLLEITQPVENAMKQQHREQLETRAKEIGVPVSVMLGSTKLQVQQLAELSVGDVIVLDQRINEPLTVNVHTCEKFRAWPGRCGAMQAIQINSVL